MANAEEELKELRALVQEGKAIVGAERVLKELRKGKITKIFLAANCPAQIRADIARLADMANAQIFPLLQNKVELGVWCKKNFAISMVGTRGE